MSINFKDAVFQDALLRVGSAPKGRQRGLVSKLTGAFASSEQKRQQRLNELFADKEFFNQEMGLRNTILRSEDQAADRSLRSEKRGLAITTVAGLGTGVVDHLLGRQRAQKLQEQTRLQNQHRRRMELNATQRARFGEYLDYSSEV
jgi:hypothetical protein